MPTKRPLRPEKLRFAKLLITARTKRGYRDAYTFFHDNGGAETFGFSYHHYHLIEKGVRLPSRAGFKTILDTLGSKHFIYLTWYQLVVAYMKAVLGGDDFFDPVFMPPLPPAKPIEDNPLAAIDRKLLSKTALHKARSKPRLTAAQEGVELSSPEAFWVFQWLSSTGLRQTGAELARALRMPEATVERAARGLFEAKMIKMSKSSYYSPDFEEGILSPSSTSLERLNLIGEYTSQMVMKLADDGLYQRFLVAVEDRAQLNSLVALVNEFINKSHLLRPGSVVKKGVFASVEARLATLLPIRED